MDETFEVATSQPFKVCQHDDHGYTIVRQGVCLREALIDEHKGLRQMTADGNRIFLFCLNHGQACHRRRHDNVKV